MNLRSGSRRWLSPALFALAALAFLLPFATVSCDQAKTSFTGVQLVTHTVPQGGNVDEGADCTGDISRCVESQGSALATAAFVAALLGFALGLLRFRRGPGWCAAAGLLMTLLLGTNALEPLGPTVTFRSG